jgi:predicted transcriptional regulator of viral defense system
MITVYLDTKESILLKSKDSSFHVLYYILIQCDSERLVWYADKYNKQIIMDKVGLAPVTLDKLISSLKERGIITRELKGKYKLNNEIFGL